MRPGSAPSCHSRQARVRASVSSPAASVVLWPLSESQTSKSSSCSRVAIVASPFPGGIARRIGASCAPASAGGGRRGACPAPFGSAKRAFHSRRAALTRPCASSMRSSAASRSTSHALSPSASLTRHPVIVSVSASVRVDGLGWDRTAPRKRVRSSAVRYLLTPRVDEFAGGVCCARHDAGVVSGTGSTRSSSSRCSACARSISA